MNPRDIRNFKEPKSCIFKNLKKPLVFEGFWIQRPPKKASRNPRKLPREAQRTPKPTTQKPQIGTKNEHFFAKVADFIERKIAQKN